MRSLLLAAVAAATATAAAATSLTRDYSSFFVFGDSLSDTGNVFANTPNAAIPAQIPAAPYVGGRFSNGPVWADPFIARFARAGRPTAGLAFGLANAASDGPSLDLAEQIGLFAFGGFPAALGPRPLVSLWFGANDIFRAVDEDLPATETAAVGAAAAQAVAGGIGALAGFGVSDFLVFNLPDLGLTPTYAGAAADRADEASAGSAAFNDALSLALDALPDDLTVTLVDIDALFADLRADPSAFGFDNVTDACFPGDALSVSLGAVVGCADASGLVFFDNVHPTTQVHRRIAAEARTALAPVPIGPAAPLLASALGVLAAMAATRRRRPAPAGATA